MTDFIVDPLVDFCVDVIGEIGYLGIFLLMLVESANIPMPSEATMLFAGFQVEEGELTLLGITAAGVLGNIVGSWAGYAIGYYGREGILEKYPIFHVSPKQMARVEDWFERYGGGDRLLHPDAPDRADLHLDARGRRPHEPRQVHDLHGRRVHPLGADARASSASRSARTGRSGATSSTTSTTSCSPG